MPTAMLEEEIDHLPPPPPPPPLKEKVSSWQDTKLHPIWGAGESELTPLFDVPVMLEIWGM